MVNGSTPAYFVTTIFTCYASFFSWWKQWVKCQKGKNHMSVSFFPKLARGFFGGLATLSNFTVFFSLKSSLKGSVQRKIFNYRISSLTITDIAASFSFCKFCFVLTWQPFRPKLDLSVPQRWPPCTTTLASLYHNFDLSVPQLWHLIPQPSPVRCGLKMVQAASVDAKLAIVF